MYNIKSYLIWQSRRFSKSIINKSICSFHVFLWKIVSLQLRQSDYKFNKNSYQKRFNWLGKTFHNSFIGIFWRNCSCLHLHSICVEVNRLMYTSEIIMIIYSDFISHHIYMQKHVTVYVFFFSCTFFWEEEFIQIDSFFSSSFYSEPLKRFSNKICS